MSAATAPAHREVLDVMAIAGEWRAGSGNRTPAERAEQEGDALRLAHDTEYGLAGAVGPTEESTTEHWVSVQRRPRPHPVP